MITSLEQEVDKLAVLTAEARPIGAQIDAAKARLARAIEAEEGLKERWAVLEEQVKANQQEKASAQTSLEELPSKAKMELERGGEYKHLETALEQILEFIETAWPAGQAAPRVSEMVHQARTILERSRSRRKEVQDGTRSNCRSTSDRNVGARGSRRPRHKHRLWST